MQLFIKNAKKGYALLTVLCLFAFFAVLGFGVLTASLSNMHSAERKLHSAQADLYAVSAVQSMHKMIESGGFESTVSVWMQEYYHYFWTPATEDETEVTIATGTEHPVSFLFPLEEPQETIQVEAVFWFTDVNIRKNPAEPEGNALVNATLNGDFTVIYTKNNQPLKFRFTSDYAPQWPEGVTVGSADCGWKLQAFEKRRDYDGE